MTGLQFRYLSTHTLTYSTMTDNRYFCFLSISVSLNTKSPNQTSKVTQVIRCKRGGGDGQFMPISKFHVQILFTLCNAGSCAYSTPVSLYNIIQTFTTESIYSRKKFTTLQANKFFLDHKTRDYLHFLYAFEF